MGGKNQTSTTSNSQTYTPTGVSQLQDIWNRVQQVSSQPYTPYSGQLVAGLDQTQTAGVQNVNNAVGSAQPLFNQAIQYGQNAAAPISSDQIQRYISPYTQGVINATQANFNEDNAQQQQQVIGNAAMKGALGGDRVGVAQAELARQQQLAQAPVIAGLQNTAYSQALSAAQADRAAQAQGAYTFGSLAPAVQNTGIAGGNAQIAAGSVLQQNQQQQLDAAYQQYLLAQAFPYQQAQFLASYGLPTVTSMGGTQTGTGTSTSPGPNLFGQVAGLGLTAAGLFLKDGGAVKGYASGGSPMSAQNFMLIPSFIPQGNAPQAYTPQLSAPQVPSGQRQQSSMPSASTISSGLGGLKNLFSGFNMSQIGTPELWGSGEYVGPLGYSPQFEKRGGRVNDDFVQAVHSIRKALKDGGTVSPSPFGPQGYDIGGLVDGPLSFADRVAPVEAAINSGQFDPQGMNYTPFTAQPIAAQPAQVSSYVPMPPERPQAPMASTRVELPPQITNPDNQPIMVPGDTMGYAPETPQRGLSPYSMTDTSTDPSQREGKGGLLGTGFLANLSPEAKLGLLSAGLGMMASRSPFALTQIGEGGLQGVQAYSQAKKETAAEADRKRNADLQAERMAQQASQFAQNLGLHKDQFGLQREQFEETKKQHAADLLKPVKIGADPITGEEIYGIRDPETSGYKILDSATGQIKTPGASAPEVSSGVPVAPPEIRAQAPAGSSAARDEGLLDEIAKKDPGLAQQIRAVADYKLDPNKTFSMRKNVRNKIMSLVYRYDPTYDSTTFPARSKAINDFSTGKLGNQIRSFDVSISHLSTLENLANALQNGDTQAINSVKNFFKTQFGSEAPTNFAAAKKIVGDEIAKGIIGGQTAVADREEFANQIKAASSPAQLAGAIRTFKQLLGGQLHGLKKQYEDTTRLHNFDERLTPQTRDEISKAEAYHSAPKAGKSEQGFTGRTATGPGGKKLRETTDGKWVP